MALRVNATIKGRLCEGAYVRIARIRGLEKDQPIVAEVHVYATADDRRHNRGPEEFFTVQVPYSDKPYDAIFNELKKAYPNAADT